MQTWKYKKAAWLSCCDKIIQNVNKWIPFTEIFFSAFIHYAHSLNERRTREKEGNNKLFFSFFYYHQLFFSYFPPFLIIIFFRLSLVRAQLTINTYVLLKSLFFSLFLSRSMCIFFSFFLSVSFLCSPHQTIDFVQLNEIKEKLCKKNSFMNEWENWIKNTESHRVKQTLIHTCDTRAHTLAQSYTRTHSVFRRCTFTGVVPVLLSNCNRSRFSVRMFAISNQNFATSKRIYICVWVWAVCSTVLDVMYGVNWDAVRVTMKNEN